MTTEIEIIPKNGYVGKITLDLSATDIVGNNLHIEDKELHTTIDQKSQEIISFEVSGENLLPKGKTLELHHFPQTAILTPVGSDNRFNISSIIVTREGNSPLTLPEQR